MNGAAAQAPDQPEATLLDVLRDGLGITGPKIGCGEGACGACTVLIGRRPVAACTTPASAAAGQRVTTVEGLAEDGILHPVQQAWLEAGAMQCGYCTPGWLTATAALLARVADPDDERIAAELDGHVCRCCTYPRIRRAVHRAAELMRHPEQLQPVPEPVLDVPGELDPGDPGPGGLPWDQAVRAADPFFGRMPDGLVTVVAPDGGPEPGGPGGSDDAWVHIGADGAITAFTGKVEAGQGTRTALSVLVAEELAVEPARVRMVMGQTDISPFDWGTFGSRSMPYAAPPLRAAAAAAREVLMETAAGRFGLPPAVLTAAGGIIAGPDGAPSAGYGDLVAGMRRVERVPPDRPVTAPADWTAAGQPARALGGADVVTGRKRFPADLRAAGMLHGAVLRPPGYGAVLRRVDPGPAQAMDGVQVVRDGDFIGVLAPSRAAAARAVAAIEADWDTEPQPAAAELEDYLRAHLVPGEGRMAAWRQEAGDPDAALAAGPVRVAATYTAAYIAHVPLEPRSALAAWRDGQLHVQTGSSTPFRARQELAAALGLPQDAVHVTVPDYGGGFGGKHGSTVALEAARLARAAGRPVKVQWSRAEEFRCGYFRPAAVIDAAASAGQAGMITGWSMTDILAGQIGLPGPYRIPAQRLVFQPARSPLPRGSYRALAATANNFARESLIDELAAAAGAEPLEFRLRHLDDERIAAVLRAAAQRLGWAPGRPPGLPDGAGAGLACGFEKGGRVATAAQVTVGGRGELTVRRLVTAFDCGAVVNPDNLANQIEGAVMMGLGGALFEAVDFAGGRLLNGSMAAYRVPRLSDLPEVEVVLADRPDQPPAGGGETPIIGVAPAIANAVFAACGTRLRSMPLAPGGRVPGI